LETVKKWGGVPKQLILLILDSQAELKSVNEKPNHKLMYLDGFGKADGFSH